MTAPVVAFSHQAPNLVSRYADTDAWRVRWFSSGEQPLAIIVHTLDAYHAAKCVQGARVVWFFHSGRIGWLDGGERPVEPDLVQEIMVASHAMKDMWQRRYSNAKIWVVAPWYRANPVWRWVPNRFFSMLNDPKTRWPERGNATTRVMTIARTQHGIAGWSLFGTGQPAGLLAGVLRDELMRACTGYVDLVPSYGGFGLAHHEMFAAGVPVVSTRWGDYEQLTAMKPVPWLGHINYPLGITQENCVDLVRLLNEDQTFAEYVSVAGLAYIRQHRTKAVMDDGIKQFLEGK